METEVHFPDTAGRSIVYVRPIKVSELPQDIRDQLGGLTEIYAVHHEEGERMALVADRALAFALARRNDFEPVSVH